MNKEQIEHLWKKATNNPHHDTNWHDAQVIEFAKLVAKHTLANIDPSSFMSWQEGYEAGKQAERDALRADAERYRYLRNRNPDRVLFARGSAAGVWIDCEDDSETLTMLTGNDADAAIDAARSKT